MTLINLFIAGCFAWFGYKLICLAIEACKVAIRQANDLEKQFGTDIGAALRFQLGLGQKDKDNG
jgi:hypothetical protein